MRKLGNEGRANGLIMKPSLIFLVSRRSTDFFFFFWIRLSDGAGRWKLPVSRRRALALAFAATLLVVFDFSVVLGCSI